MACPGGDPVEQARQAFVTALFVRYRGTLLRYAERLVGSVEDAADLVQETYYRVMRRPMASQFEAAVRAYLFQTMRNLAKDSYRRNGRRFASSHVAVDDELPDAALTPEEFVASQQTATELLLAVRRLPSEQRVVLLLNREQDMTLEDIAEHLGISKRTAERRLRTAIESLVQAMRLAR
ncbi:MAG: sigma-70 family RNA polymerase sigma factor [Gammaproteobacteria bacterium]|nr:sigma-70 family RNA polymerase sigma factor [Gammaproteobacteria bacterium]